MQFRWRDCYTYMHIFTLHLHTTYEYAPHCHTYKQPHAQLHNSKWLCAHWYIFKPPQWHNTCIFLQHTSYIHNCTHAYIHIRNIFIADEYCMLSICSALRTVKWKSVLTSAWNRILWRNYWFIFANFSGWSTILHIQRAPAFWKINTNVFILRNFLLKLQHLYN